MVYYAQSGDPARKVPVFVGAPIFNVRTSLFSINRLPFLKTSFIFNLFSIDLTFLKIFGNHVKIQNN